MMHLANPLVIGEYTLDRSSSVEVVFPLERAFWGNRRSIDAKVLFYLNFEGFVCLSLFACSHSAGKYCSGTVICRLCFCNDCEPN